MYKQSKKRSINDVGERARGVQEFFTFRSYVAKKPRPDMRSQWEDLVKTHMLKAVFPRLNALANIIIMLIPVGTASVESFSQIKMIKSCLRNDEEELSYSTKIEMKSPRDVSGRDSACM